MGCGATKPVEPEQAPPALATKGLTVQPHHNVLTTPLTSQQASPAHPVSPLSPLASPAHACARGGAIVELRIEVPPLAVFRAFDSPRHHIPDPDAVTPFLPPALQGSPARGAPASAGALHPAMSITEASCTSIAQSPAAAAASAVAGMSIPPPPPLSAAQQQQLANARGGASGVVSPHRPPALALGEAITSPTAVAAAAAKRRSDSRRSSAHVTTNGFLSSRADDFDVASETRSPRVVGLSPSGGPDFGSDAGVLLEEDEYIVDFVSLFPPSQQALAAAATTASVAHCPVCSTAVRLASAKFCHECGARLPPRRESLGAQAADLLSTTVDGPEDVSDGAGSALDGVVCVGAPTAPPPSSAGGGGAVGAGVSLFSAQVGSFAACAQSTTTVGSSAGGGLRQELSGDAAGGPRPTRVYHRRVKVSHSGAAVLGRGAHGSVFKCIDVRSGELLAVKEMRANLRDADEVSRVRRELRSLSLLRHPHVVEYLGCSVEPGAGPDDPTGRVSILMERLECGSLADLLRSFPRGIPESAVRSYTAQLLEGLAFLHARHVSHKDIKCANLLLTASGMVKISDFGAATVPQQFGDASGDGIIGTPAYLPPETCEPVARGDALRRGIKIDCWSVGVVVHELLTGEEPWAWAGLGPLQLLLRMRTLTFRVSDRVSPLARSFLARCLDPCVDTRATAEELLQHDFVRLHDAPPADMAELPLAVQEV